tara:strand:- start:595 stop:1281 length:687 start_codon:yes stop_codon:yes gene_type:complete
MILSWQQIPSPLISEIMCHNFDGVVLDTEHGCYDNETLFSCIQVIKASQKKCFVRLTEISKTMIRYCLDAAVDGLILSTVETKKQCEKIIEYCYYSPKGKRGLGLVRQNLWGEKNLIQSDPIIIPQIESKKAVDNLKEIIKFNFDYYLIGPYDLSLSLNKPGQFDDEEFLCYIDKVNKILNKDKMAVHIPKNINKEIHKYKNYGLKCLGMDTIAVIEYNKEILKDVKF